MYRLRFQTIKQLFEIPEDASVILPLEELSAHIDEPGIQGLVSNGRIIAEMPSVLWEGSIGKVKNMLTDLKEKGLEDVLCENIGAINICNELGLKFHGGMYLNVLNSVSAGEYEGLGAKDLTLSFEMPFPKQRALLSVVKKQGIDLPLGIVVYGYLPLMKFRACPAMGKEGCKGCSRDKYLTDRKGERFRILCHDSKYSELLNCVPLYAADKALPDMNFYTLYFTVEDKKECETIFRMVQASEIPSFRRTAGLYARELL